MNNDDGSPKFIEYPMQSDQFKLRKESVAGSLMCCCDL